jgi:hypothetical protein
MNTSLSITYHPSKAPGCDTVCRVTVDGTSFVSLGLEKGQTALTSQQLAWFEEHGDVVVSVCKRWAAAVKDQSNVTGYRLATSHKHAMLDRFVMDCAVKDS